MPADGEVVYMHGKVVDSETGAGIGGVVVDVWEASTNGLYEQQDPEQEDCNLRGRVRTEKDGGYAFYCLRPTAYPVPCDGMSFLFDTFLQWDCRYILTDVQRP